MRTLAPLLLLAACSSSTPLDSADTAGLLDPHDTADTADTAMDTADSGLDTADSGGDTADSADTGDTGVNPDGDGDGYTPTEGDCDDDAPDVHPGAPELCNDRDDDCDRAVDEDAGDTYYGDADRDGYGDSSSTTVSCHTPPDSAFVGGDCDDTDETINPGAEDLCEDGIDQDCTGADRACRTEGALSVGTASAILRGQAGEYAGARLSAAGDVNGDGQADAWVGSYGAGPSGVDFSGAVSLVYGPLTGEHDVRDVAVTTLYGSAASEYAGWDLSGGDDLDGDGTPDVAIGAYGYTDASGYNGAVYVVSGAGTSGSLSGADGVITTGGLDISNLGYDMGTSPDLTGDGIGDVILGSYGRGSDGYRGAAWVFAGPVVGTHTVTEAFEILGDDPVDLAGNGVAGVGDTNGDGVADLLVGAHGDDDAGDAAGAASLFYGPITGDLAMADADRKITGERAADEVSRNSVGGRGDLDGDGLDDVIVGGMFASPTASYCGAAYVVLGEASASGSMSASAAAVRVYGTNANDFLGRTAEFADVDGDGQLDLAVGAPGADVAAADDGAVYVFYAPVSGSYVGADAGLAYNGVASGDSLGLALSNAGDVSGTGSDQLFVGAWSNDDNGASSGAAYVVP